MLIVMQVPPKLLEQLLKGESPISSKLMAQTFQCKKCRVQLSCHKKPHPNHLVIPIIIISWRKINRMLSYGTIFAAKRLENHEVHYPPKVFGIVWVGIGDSADHLKSDVDNVPIPALEKAEDVCEEEFFHGWLEKVAIDTAKAAEELEELDDQSWRFDVAEAACENSDHAVEGFKTGREEDSGLIGRDAGLWDFDSDAVAKVTEYGDLVLGGAGQEVVESRQKITKALEDLRLIDIALKKKKLILVLWIAFVDPGLADRAEAILGLGVDVLLQFHLYRSRYDRRCTLRTA
jgi:hypothetical protein